MFRELHATNDFTELGSAADRRWRVGFNRRGRRLAAARWLSAGRRRRRRCYQFVKTDQRPAAASRDLPSTGARWAAPRIDYAAWYDRLALRYRNATSSRH